MNNSPRLTKLVLSPAQRAQAAARLAPPAVPVAAPEPPPRPFRYPTHRSSSTPVLDTAAAPGAPEPQPHRQPLALLGECFPEEIRPEPTRATGTSTTMRIAPPGADPSIDALSAELSDLLRQKDENLQALADIKAQLDGAKAAAAAGAPADDNWYHRATTAARYKGNLDQQLSRQIAELKQRIKQLQREYADARNRERKAGFEAMFFAVARARLPPETFQALAIAAGELSDRDREKPTSPPKKARAVEAKAEPQAKRGRGRPRGAKDSQPRKPRAAAKIHQEEDRA